MRPLTDYEQRVLAMVEADKSREQNAGGPWERGWVCPSSSPEAAAMRRLARRGLVEESRGRGKLPSRYRALAPASD